jgi:hypothetical protein
MFRCETCTATSEVRSPDMLLGLIKYRRHVIRYNLPLVSQVDCRGQLISMYVVLTLLA